METINKTSLVESLEWRYATKKFDSSQRVTDEHIDQLKQAINLAATSYGLQPFRVLVVTDQATKEKLKEAAYGQSQMTDASHVFVFAHKLDISDEYVDDYMNRIAQTRNVSIEKLQGFGNTIKGSIKGKSTEDIREWNRRQAYIGLGHLLVAAADIRVDVCPMEGFDAQQVDEILGLPEMGLSTAVAAPVGFRSEDDSLQSATKVRLPQEELFINV